MPEWQKIKMGGLEQYGAERFGRLIFATIRKKCGTERVKELRIEIIFLAYIVTLSRTL